MRKIQTTRRTKDLASLSKYKLAKINTRIIHSEEVAAHPTHKKEDPTV